MLDVPKKPQDPGLIAVVMLMRFYDVAADPSQIEHRFRHMPIGVPEMLRCAKDFKLKARAVTSKWSRLSGSALPAIACLKDGGFCIVGKASGDEVLVSNLSSPRPEVLSRATFESLWNGRLVFMTRRAALHALSNRFGI